ncbi:MAG: phage terminase large subunit [Acidimicrobiales bacterium]
MEMTLEDAQLVVLRWLEATPPQRRVARHGLKVALELIAEHDLVKAAELIELCRLAVEKPLWRKTARPDQLAPGEAGSVDTRTDWDTWLVIAGRGWGKSECSAQWAASKLIGGNIRLALVAATFAAGRDDMAEGSSGLLRCLPPSILIDGSLERSWNRSQGQLKLANGSHARIFSSEKPGLLRGPQHHYAWVDELAKFKDANVPTTEDSTWSNLMMTMRLGPHPQVVVSTTPRPCMVLTGTRDKPEIGLMHAQNTIVTHGTTYENMENLPETFQRRLLAYEGTRLGRQELYAEILDDVEGALWTSHLIESARISRGWIDEFHGGLTRIVVGVDPSVGMGEEHNDECGIVVAGRSRDGHGFVLDDRSGHMSPEKWARTAVRAFHEHEADLIVAEKNNGGQLVGEMIRITDNRVPVKLVTSKRAKYTRAEPVAALYEQGLIHHVGIFPELEDEMTSYVPNDKKQDSPDHLDSLVFAVSALFDLNGREQPMTHSVRSNAAVRR